MQKLANTGLFFKKYLHAIIGTAVRNEATTIPSKFLKKTARLNSLCFFNNKITNIPVMYIADSAVASTRPFIPMTNGKERFKARLMSTPIVAFFAGVVLSFSE